MDSELRNTPPPVQLDGILIGKLIQAVENNTRITDHLCGKVSSLKDEQTRVAITFENINRDIMEIRNSIASKPSTGDIITIIDKRLEIYGLDDPRECSRDAAYIRDNRTNDATLKQRVKIAAIVAITLAALSWGGSATYAKIKNDINIEQPRSK